LLQHGLSGELEAAQAVAAEVAAIGERFRDQDLVAIGLMEHGHALVRQGRTGEGLRLVDETMVAVTTGELSPIVAGIVYCNTMHSAETPGAPLPPGPGRFGSRLPVGGGVARRPSRLPRSGYPRHQ
jgi:hypothetical protein